MIFSGRFFKAFCLISLYKVTALTVPRILSDTPDHYHAHISWPPKFKVFLQAVLLTTLRVLIDWKNSLYPSLGGWFSSYLFSIKCTNHPIRRDILILLHIYDLTNEFLEKFLLFNWLIHWIIHITDRFLIFHQHHKNDHLFIYNFTSTLLFACNHFYFKIILSLATSIAILTTINNYE